MKKIVITGGPSSGKSTFINELKKREELVLEEVATGIISEENKKVNGILPWSDFDRFEELLLAKQIELENFLSNLNYDRVFLDRGLIDILAYYDFTKRNISEKIIKTVNDYHKYHKVFFFETLPKTYWNIHSHDFERKVTYEQGNEIAELIYKRYVEFGYKPIIIEVKSVEERIKEIISNL